MTDSKKEISAQTDTLFTKTVEKGSFAFDQAVARVFPDMIRRSVPGYAETVAMSGIIANRYLQPNSCIYDLGCSLGAVTLAMRHAVSANPAMASSKLIGIDNSQAMIEQAGHYVAIDDCDIPVELHCADILDLEIQQASVVTLNFVLQFIEQSQRSELLTKICQGILEGGALVLSEKIAFEDSEQATQNELHWDFKRANGYSDMEIAQKRNAIEDVLVPESHEVHVERLKQAGFSQIVRWYQCFNFVSYLAIK